MQSMSSLLKGTNKFTMSNGQIQGIRGEIECLSVNVIYYLKCKRCSEKKTNIGKTIRDLNYE